MHTSARMLIKAGLALAAMWLAYFILGGWITDTLADRFGQAVLRASEGKYTDAAVFIRHRLCDAGVLLTWAAGLVAAGTLGHGLIARRLPPLWRWVSATVLVLVGVNLWLGLAMDRALFWTCFWSGKTHVPPPHVLFNLKRIFAEEDPVPHKILLLGNSQTKSQLDPAVLNASLPRDRHIWELHSPGATWFDLLLIQAKVRAIKPEVVVCYVSEGLFFSGGTNDVSSVSLPLFFRLNDFPLYWQLGQGKVTAGQSMFYGALGHVLPVFRLRDSLAQRVYGWKVMDVAMARKFKTWEGLLAHPEEVARGYALGPAADFEAAAFEEFIRRYEQQGTKVIVFPGRLNPQLEAKLDPRLRRAMRELLKRTAARHRNLIVVEESALPAQPASAYHDFYHVDKDTQKSFSEFAARTLGPLL